MSNVPPTPDAAIRLSDAWLRTALTTVLLLGACSNDFSEEFRDLSLDSGFATEEENAEGDPRGDAGRDTTAPDGGNTTARDGGDSSARDGGDSSARDGGDSSALDGSTASADGGTIAIDSGTGATDSGTATTDGGATDMDASAGDGGPANQADASVLADASTGPGTVVEDDAGVHCDFGSAENQASTGTLNLFGEVVYFANGYVFPPGTYRVVYEDGCMKYASSQAWTIHAYNTAGIDHRWWIVGESSTDRKVIAPGTVGIAVGAGGHQTFSQCVAANLGVAPRTFAHAGGKLGVWLNDSNYPDNVQGEGDRNPKWRLERLDGCDAPPIE